METIQSFSRSGRAANLTLLTLRFPQSRGALNLSELGGLSPLALDGGSLSLEGILTPGETPGGTTVQSERWLSGRGRRSVGTILVIAGALLLAIPMSSAIGQPASGTATGARTHPSPSVTSGAHCVVGTNPYFPAYDPVSHDVYVPNLGSASISILSGTCKLVGKVTLPAGAEPAAAGFNPSNNLVYVTDTGLNHVYVILGTKLVRTIKSLTFSSPLGVAFDPAISNMAVANFGSDTVTFIHDTSVSFTTTVGSGPDLFAYDPTFGRLLVTNFYNNTVTSMSALYPFIQSDNINIAVGTEPAGIAFDYANGYDYVANQGSNNVTLIDSTGGHYGSISVGSRPLGAVWDQAKLSVYVANGGSSTVSVIKGSSVSRTIHGPSASVLKGIAFDEATDQVFVTGTGNGVVYIYS